MYNLPFNGSFHFLCDTDSAEQDGQCSSSPGLSALRGLITHPSLYCTSVTLHLYDQTQQKYLKVETVYLALVFRRDSAHHDRGGRVERLQLWG